MRGWSHAAMLLLGVTLAVGFYEGRRLVTNTMRALRVADASPGLAVRLDPDSLENRGEDARRARSGTRKGTRSNEDDPNAQRERIRSRGGGDGDRLPSAGVARLPSEPADPHEDDTGEALP
jgi:hypothetical protein